MCDLQLTVIAPKPVLQKAEGLQKALDILEFT